MTRSTKSAGKIAIVDDEQDMRQSISQWLSLSGHETETYASAEDALMQIGPNYPGIVISDIKMPGIDGITFLRRLMGLDSSLPVILITGHGDVAMAVEAMRIGAYDFLEKPFNPDRMSEIARRALTTRRLTLDNRMLRRELSDGTALMRKLIGSSAVMERLREDILDLGQADSHVLITGEAGTGKTLVAQALHAVGARQGKRLVSLSCAAFDIKTLDAALFKGIRNDIAMVEQARGGTLVIEDIEAMPADIQAKFLTFLNDLDASSEIRVVAIFNGMGSEKTCEEILRPDLYYRLAGLNLTVPPLRERGEDILTLFTHFADQFAEDYGTDAPQITAIEAAQLLQAAWPGNVRQLINLAERSVLQKRRGVGSITVLLDENTGALSSVPLTTQGKPLKEYVDAFERMLIENTMRRHRGSIAGVMEELSLPRRTLNEKMAKYGLSRGNYL